MTGLDYIHVMEHKKQGSEALGADDPTAINFNNVKGWIKKDCTLAIRMLEAIVTDEDCLNMLTTFFVGRYENAKHQDSLKNQPVEQ